MPVSEHELKIAGGNLADRWERFLDRFAQMKVLTGVENSASVNMIRKLEKMNLRKKTSPCSGTSNKIRPDT